MSHWKQLLRRFLPHAIAGLIILYSIAGGYIYINATQNNFSGTTWITNINMLGKILQYNMQDNVEPTDQRAVAISHQIDSHLKKHLHDPYVMMARDPKLFDNHAAEIGKYSQSIIIHHPRLSLLKLSHSSFHRLQHVIRNHASIAQAYLVIRYITCSKHRCLFIQ
ncbi:hypothetical protein [Dictyobacter vulcani]|uniref:hypothetical protein n=1 Tax=Dictyobacter vulcani TaxID=2607529 RepID=UPI00124FDD52|nr:hypothetical protein [Dictyobacter vulcani]